MTIYLDVLFLLNVWLDYLLLVLTARFSGVYARRGRMLLASVMGGGYALFSFLLPLPRLLSPLPALACAAGMVQLSFGRKERLLRLSALFCLLSAAFAGAVMAIHQLWRGASIRNGVFYMDVTLGQIGLAAVAGIGVVTLALRRQGREGALGNTVVVTARWQQRQVRFTALYDNGNELHDPVSGRAALVVEAQALKGLLPPPYAFLVEQIGQTDPAELLKRVAALPQGSRFGLLFCRTVGTEKTALLTLRPDEILLGQRPVQALLALTSVSLGQGAYDALVGIDG